jgi:hypothetical protein
VLAWVRGGWIAFISFVAIADNGNTTSIQPWQKQMIANCYKLFEDQKETDSVHGNVLWGGNITFTRQHLTNTVTHLHNT